MYKNLPQNLVCKYYKHSYKCTQLLTITYSPNFYYPIYSQLSITHQKTDSELRNNFHLCWRPQINITNYTINNTLFTVKYYAKLYCCVHIIHSIYSGEIHRNFKSPSTIVNTKLHNESSLVGTVNNEDATCSKDTMCNKVGRGGGLLSLFR